MNFAMKTLKKKRDGDVKAIDFKMDSLIKNG